MSTFRKPLLFALASAGVVALAIWGWLPYQSAQSAASPAAPPAGRTSSEGGQTIVALDEATQKLSGIETNVLAATNQQAEHLAYGSVLDLQPLIDLRARYLTAAADVRQRTGGRRRLGPGRRT